MLSTGVRNRGSCGHAAIQMSLCLFHCGEDKCNAKQMEQLYLCCCRKHLQSAGTRQRAEEAPTGNSHSNVEWLTHFFLIVSALKRNHTFHRRQSRSSYFSRGFPPASRYDDDDTWL